VPVERALAHSRSPGSVQQVTLTSIAGQPRYRLKKARGDLLVVDASTERRLPALRLDFDDPGRTSVYLDPFTGDVALSMDRSQRTGRWLFNLLHSWDLPLFLRFSGTRDTALVLLSLGSLAIAVTGVVIGWRRSKTFCLQRFRKASVRAH
jgi:uncharacterized iron-regulated membrane protein